MTTLASIYSVYESGHMGRLAPKTQAAYRSVMRHAVKDLPASPVGPDVAAWLDKNLGEHQAVHAVYKLRVLQSVVRRGVELGGDGADLLRAVLAVRAPHTPPSKRCMPPADLVERALGAARSRGECAFIRLAARGLRKNEMLGLLPEDIGADGAITVCRQRGRPHRKNRIAYVVKVDAETLADLRWTIENRDKVTPENGRWNDTPTSAGCVFPWGETYLALFMDRIRDHFGADVDRYLPDGKAWHQFRRRMAKDAKDRGEASNKIADRLGDKSEQMARVYADDGSMVNELPVKSSLVARLLSLAEREAMRVLARIVRPLNERMAMHHG